MGIRSLGITPVTQLGWVAVSCTPVHVDIVCFLRPVVVRTLLCCCLVQLVIVTCVPIPIRTAKPQMTGATLGN